MSLRDHKVGTFGLQLTFRCSRMVLQSLSGFSFSVSPKLLQLELCCCSSQHTHTPSLSNLSWGKEGENTHPHSCMPATRTRHMHSHIQRHTHQTHVHKSDLSLNLLLENTFTPDMNYNFMRHCDTWMYCIVLAAAHDLARVYEKRREGCDTPREALKHSIPLLCVPDWEKAGHDPNKGGLITLGKGEEER